MKLRGVIVVFFLFAFSLMSGKALAQNAQAGKIPTKPKNDIIITMSGYRMPVVIKENTPEFVRYVNLAVSDSLEFILAKEDILSIKFASGEKKYYGAVVRDTSRINARRLAREARYLAVGGEGYGLGVDSGSGTGACAGTGGAFSRSRPVVKFHGYASVGAIGEFFLCPMAYVSLETSLGMTINERNYVGFRLGVGGINPADDIPYLGLPFGVEYRVRFPSRNRKIMCSFGVETGVHLLFQRWTSAYNPSEVYVDDAYPIMYFKLNFGIEKGRFFFLAGFSGTVIWFLPVGGPEIRFGINF